jgi:hypothetical protein
MPEKVKVAYPLMLRAVAAAKRKNDRIDAGKIADCLRRALPIGQLNCVGLLAGCGYPGGVSRWVSLAFANHHDSTQKSIATILDCLREREPMLVLC